MEELNIGLLTVKRLFQLCIQKLSCREQPHLFQERAGVFQLNHVLHLPTRSHMIYRYYGLLCLFRNRKYMGDEYSVKR